MTAGYDGDAAATADDAGSIISPVTISTSASGWEQEGDGKDTATITIIDDDTAGVRVTAAAPVSVVEGGTGAYTVVLDSQPTHDVTITPSSDNAAKATVTPASWTFTRPTGTRPRASP